ncbi:hypothetical protein [Streptomyces sp. SGAir0957]
MSTLLAHPALALAALITFGALTGAACAAIGCVIDHGHGRQT